MKRRAVSGSILALAGVWLWSLAVGAARPDSLSAPAGEAGLCLALVAWWCGATREGAATIWSLCLVGSTLLTGVPPWWPFLLGLPAWLLVRALGEGKERLTYLILAACLLSLVRFAGKLLYLSFLPHAPLTLSGGSLAGSFWAELAPNALFCALFALLLGAPERRGSRLTSALRLQ